MMKWWGRLRGGAKVVIVLAALVALAVVTWLVRPAPSVTRDIATGGVTPGGVGCSGLELDRPLRVGIVTWGGYAGGIVANNGFKPNKDSMFYKDHCIQTELLVIDDFAASRDAFKAGGAKGGVDVLWSTVDAFALEYPALKSLKPVAFLQYDWSYGGDAIAVGPGIKSASDLKGKSIAVAQDTPSHFFALFVLDQAKLKTNDVNFVFTAASPDSANVFKARKADAVVAWSPDPEMAVKAVPGSKILMSTKQASRIIADIFIAQSDFINKNPNVMRAFTAGWLRGVDAAHKDPKKAVELLAKSFPGISADDAAAMYDNVQLPTYADNRKFFEVDGTEQYGYDRLFEIATDLWQSLGKVTEKTPARDTRMNGLVRDVSGLFAGSQTTAEAAPGDINKASSCLKEVFNITFESNKWDLKPGHEASIKRMAEKARAFGGAFVKVSGHTDPVGDRGYNKYLSLERALSVVTKLVNDYQIPYNRLTVEGAGPDRPIPGVSPANEDGRAQLRRTEVEVLCPE